MIPDKKKTPEEIAALREGLGIPDALPQPGEHRSRPAQLPAMDAAPISKPAPDHPKMSEVPAPVLDPIHPDKSPIMELREPVVHLDIPPAPPEPEKPPTPIKHSLRKHELPLAPAPVVTHKTELPNSRHQAKDIAEIRRRAALDSLEGTQKDPAAHLRKITAHWTLLVPAYLLSLGAAGAAWQRVHHVTPLALLALSFLLAIYIFIWKKRSRHHAAILAIIIIMTLVFGGLYYAPLFQYAP